MRYFRRDFKHYLAKLLPFHSLQFILFVLRTPWSTHKLLIAEVFFLSGVNASTYRTELERQLRKMTLGISVGLVKQSPAEVAAGAGGGRGRKYFFDPYTHFRPADADEQGGGGGGDDDDIVHR